MSKIQDKNKNKKAITNTRNYIPNISSVVLILCFCGLYIYERYKDSQMTGSNLSEFLVNVVIMMVLVLILLMLVFKYANNTTTLGFFVPAILFVFYTLFLSAYNWDFPSSFLLACFCFSLISCLYYNLNLSILFIVAQYIAAGVLIMNGYPVMGEGVLLTKVWVTWAVSLFGGLVMLVLTRTATVVLNRALASQKSFRTLLSTTTSNIAMIDGLNQVIYVSDSMTELTGIESPELAIGRPLIDLFPGRDLKLLVHRMLKNKQMWTDDWEFSLDGHKRYFKAIATGLAGTSGEALINLQDMTHLAERDEINIMKDSLRIGMFFMDKEYIIQDHYSRFLEEMFVETDLFRKHFPDLLSASVTEKELETIKDYFSMVIEQSLDKDMLKEINPLNEIHYVSRSDGSKKVFHCDFATIERGRGEIYVLVTVYDITMNIQLKRELAEREARRQEEMQSIFELIQVDQEVFNDFQEDASEKFGEVNNILKNQSAMSTHDALVEIYQQIHAIKSNAVILGLNVFGNKAHNLESIVKKLREQEGEVAFDSMLGLTLEIEKLVEEFDGFKATISKVQTLNKGGGNQDGRSQVEYVLVESLSKAASKAAQDMEKKVQFVVDEIQIEALEKGPKRVIKDVLMQLIRNSVVHGVELPEERISKGKDETGLIKLSIKVEGGNINVRLEDDGKGLDYDKIRAKAEEKNMIQPEDRDNINVLTKLIFQPEFSTAETEGVHAGRGIGLNLVRDRINDVHGSIKVQSNPDKGTAFTITIPM